jgi:hypothetical protein
MHTPKMPAHVQAFFCSGGAQARAGLAVWGLRPNSAGGLCDQIFNERSDVASHVIGGCMAATNRKWVVHIHGFATLAIDGETGRPSVRRVPAMRLVGVMMPLGR